ncbi:MAG: hypothetical protein WBD10_00675 [Acidobacteriaceae bacterium]
MSGFNAAFNSGPVRVICNNDYVRRILAISLLMLFALPFTMPLFGAEGTAASVPACCRRNGKHHCVMSMGSSRDSSAPIVWQKCPYSIMPPAVLVLPSFTPSPSASIFAGVTRHPAVSAQVEARQRVSFDRARQKRGPPAFIA